MITEAGIYPNITPEQYFAEPCPAPALTNSLIGILSRKSPAHARAAHPSLNPNYVRRHSTAIMARGSLVHRLALGKGEEIIVSPYDEYRTKEAKEWKAAQPDDALVVKRKQLEEAEAMSGEVKREIDRICGGHEYQTEVVFAWKEGDIWCRAMMDVWCPSLNLIIDPKSCMDASDEAVDRSFAKGYARQQAWYERGIEAITGVRPEFKFLFVEADPPHMTRIASGSEGMREGATAECERAINIFSSCLNSGEWPGYKERIVHPTSWQVRQWEEAALDEMEEENG